IVIIITVIYSYFLYSFTYWKRKDVPYIQPSFPFGNISAMFFRKQSMSQVMSNLYNSVQKPFFGIYVFLFPRLVVKDPELIKMIMVKDFQNFQNRGNEFDPKTNALASNLFSLSGEAWVKLRNVLSPAFTSGKLKVMMETITKCGEQLQEHLSEKAKNSEVVEFKDLAARYTTDIIASVAFGIDVNSVKNPDDEFRQIGKKIFQVSNYKDFIVKLLFHNCPELINLLRISIINADVYKFIMNIVQQIVTLREKKGVVRNDFMQMLIQLRNSGKVNEDDGMKVKIKDAKLLSIEAIAAEARLFLAAGFETSSMTMSSFFYEISQNPYIMKKVQNEIDTCVKRYGGFTYEALNDMKYLENCISETLRLYPVLLSLTRECLTDYKIPGSKTVIPKGTRVLIPLLGLQRDPKYFSNPEKFDPDRFSDDRKDSITPYTYMPFGEGRRACIGMRLAKLQMKVGLAMTLYKFDILKSAKTSQEIRHDPESSGVSLLGGIWLQVAHRK
ncbi:cytochrome P450 6k1-like, partial [Ctenocephalides felis]|uniref:cytochrome P450 6k1-like n=1 Tax=Ctenocephalides felis TaxID=7515 RepID=UPI000E6E2DB4